MQCIAKKKEHKELGWAKDRYVQGQPREETRPTEKTHLRRGCDEPATVNTNNQMPLVYIKKRLIKAESTVNCICVFNNI